MLVDQSEYSTSKGSGFLCIQIWMVSYGKITGSLVVFAQLFERVITVFIYSRPRLVAAPYSMGKYASRSYSHISVEKVHLQVSGTVSKP